MRIGRSDRFIAQDAQKVAQNSPPGPVHREKVHDQEISGVCHWEEPSVGGGPFPIE
jgi:hypothetical protein